MFIFYCSLIMKGSNRKIEASIEKFQSEHNKSYGIFQLSIFLFINEITFSSLLS